MFSHVSNCQYDNIGSSNGFAPNRRQAITCTNDGPLHWRIYAALGGNELNEVNQWFGVVRYSRFESLQFHRPLSFTPYQTT